MKILFYLAMFGVMGVGVLIYLEKNKKSNKLLIDESKDNTKTEKNLQTNNNAQTR